MKTRLEIRSGRTKTLGAAADHALARICGRRAH